MKNMVTIGPIEDVPRWAIAIVLLGVGWFFIREGIFPSVYDLFGISIPLQDISVLVILLMIGLAVLYQFQNVLQ